MSRSLEILFRRRRCHAAIGLAILLGACESAAPLLGSSPEPALYLVLSREPDFDAPPLEPVTGDLFALLVTMGTPEHSIYRSAEQFVMRRVSDGAVFDWTSVPRSGTASPVHGGLLQADAGNWRLPWAGTGGRLGRDSLVSGESYELQVETEGRTIVGKVEIPSTPTIEFEHVDGVTRVHWARSTGAVAFWVIIDTESPAALLTEDTVYVLRRNVPADDRPDPPFVRVIAIGPNLLAIANDTLVLQSGLTGAFGVFGATSTARRAIPDAP